MALDEATRNLLQAMAAQGGPPLHEMQPAEARAMGAGLTAMMGPGPDVARVDHHLLIGVDGGSFDVRVLVPSNDPAAVILYLHGGGWVTGHIDEFDTLGRKLAIATGCAVVLVNYRKAPENQYPIAVEDAWTALQWADTHCADIAGRDVPLVVSGDSAGGNLATVIAFRARDAGGPPVAAQVLVYPVTDADLTTTSYLDASNELLLNRQSMQWFWDHYCPPERRGEPDASPLRAVDLTGLPPAVVLLAEHDVLRSEGEAYASALDSAGVPVRLKVFEGQMHGFFTMVNLLPGSAAGIEWTASALADVLAAQTATTGGAL